MKSCKCCKAWSNSGGRLELAEREQQEIDVIQRYLPKQMTEDEIEQAVQDLIEEMNASGLKQMGAVMGELRDRYAGQMDFAKASPIVKQKLA